MNIDLSKDEIQTIRNSIESYAYRLLTEKQPTNTEYKKTRTLLKKFYDLCQNKKQGD